MDGGALLAGRSVRGSGKEAEMTKRLSACTGLMVRTAFFCILEMSNAYLSFGVLV